MQAPKPLSFRLEDGKKRYEFNAEGLQKYLATTKETALGIVDSNGRSVSALPVASLRRLLKESEGRVLNNLYFASNRECPQPVVVKRNLVVFNEQRMPPAIWTLNNCTFRNRPEWEHRPVFGFAHGFSLSSPAET